MLLISKSARVLARHNQRNPARCHRSTVSGVTTIRTCFHPADQNTCAKIQKALSNIVSLGLGCLRFNAASCWRRAKFSRSSSRRARNTRQIAPSRSANRFIMSCCYRIFLVEEKGYPVEISAEQNFGEGQPDNSPRRQGRSCVK